ncbi:MAG: flavodoxin family protein [Desulfobacteraceae bacterium]|nr:MAG: flavodoxin family protein [Desulfobacteraceae bacterium]
MILLLVGISASPRRGGNSEQLLEAFLNGAAREGWQTEMIPLNSLNFRSCQACDRCATTGKCVINDDMQLLYKKVASCQGLVMATPIYFGTLSAQLKMFMDRFQCWWHAKYSLKKPFISPEEERPAFFICVGALKTVEYCQSAEKAAKVFFHVINLKHRGSLFFRGFDHKGSITEDPANLEKAFQEGVNFTAPKKTRPKH